MGAGNIGDGGRGGGGHYETKGWEVSANYLVFPNQQ